MKLGFLFFFFLSAEQNPRVGNWEFYFICVEKFRVLDVWLRGL